jgi:hypothetical protein
MLITRLVNSVVAWGNFSVRSEREMKKVELFRLIGTLIRMGRLERVARNYVTIPATDERYRASSDSNDTFAPGVQMRVQSCKSTGRGQERLLAERFARLGKLAACATFAELASRVKDSHPADPFQSWKTVFRSFPVMPLSQAAWASSRWRRS